MMRPTQGMRLTDHEIDSIKSAVHQFDPRARIFIFGSRAREDAAGGDSDIDPFIQSIRKEMKQL